MLRTHTALVFVLAWTSLVPAADPVPGRLTPFFTTHCAACHAGEKFKGRFRVSDLSADFTDKANRDRWQSVLEHLSAGTMPPKGKPAPPPADVTAVTTWVTKAAVAAERTRRATQGRATLRRLNRVEYENTVRDLLGIQVELKELLPEDSSANGFDNSGDALHVSPFLLEKYLEAAEAALDKAIANGPQPPRVKTRYTLKDSRAVKGATESVFLPHADDLVMFSSSTWNAIVVDQFYPPDRGTYRIRISASGYQTHGKPVTYRIDAGPMLMATKSHLVGYFDAAPDKPTVIEFIDHFEARNHIRIAPYGLAAARTVTKVGAEKYTGAGLAVQWVEVEGPLHATWPPASHRRIFGDLKRKPAPRYNQSRRVEVVSDDPDADAARILRAFAGRAFRRPVTAEELKPFLDLVKAKLAAKNGFEGAIRAGLMAVMVSPDFLFLKEKAGRLTDAALAARLSYFLWSSMPDDELLAAAATGELSHPAELRAQVERLLNHPKAAAFTENFVGQWLGLRDLDATEPGFLLYPEYDALLRVSMAKESESFFAEVLKADLPLTNFVASDFAMLNGRMARHYGIPGVDGYAFRRVTLPKDSHRGGVLTMASVLKVTANGTSTSPVTRGAWVMDRILGSPLPKPPADVPAIEPDTRGATTIRQQLAKHRRLPSCNVCHVTIDPPGFALESFDVIGGFRENYRTLGNGDRKAVIVDGQKRHYRMGLKVDPADTFEGKAFADIDEFKRLLLADKDRLARALAVKVVTYATGAAPTALDEPAVRAIVQAVREKNYGFRALVHEVARSELFRMK